MFSFDGYAISLTLDMTKTNLYSQILYIHKRSIPINYVADFSLHYRMSFGTLIMMGYLGIFAYFIYFLYLENTATEFVAIEAGSNSCSEVERPLDGTFLATSSGVWEGASSFHYSNAPIQFKARELSATPAHFSNIFAEEKAHLEEINTIFENNNLAMNILYWTSYRRSVVEGGTVQTFSLVGDPSFIFNGQFAIGFLASSTKACNAVATTSFISPNFYISYAFSDYESKGCEIVANSFALGNAIQNLTSSVTARIDTQSFVTALAVNFGILSTSSSYNLEFNGINNVYVDGKWYKYFKAVDPNYPGMSPVYCMEDHWCVVHLGTYLALPIFDHWGSSLFNSSAPCRW